MNEITIDKSKTEKTIPLRELKIGDCFRLAHIKLKDAISENLIFMVISDPKKSNMVSVCALVNGTVLARDDEHRVIKHNVKFVVEI